MRVVITAAAKADLIAIGNFIKPNNSERAITFVEELLDR
jgi:toxin ParE1/3/4